MTVKGADSHYEFDSVQLAHNVPFDITMYAVVYFWVRGAFEYAVSICCPVASILRSN
jgi:hypothetical protein